MGSPARALPGHLGAAREDAGDAASIVVVLEPALDVATLERAWAAPARDALAGGAFDAVTLLADDMGDAVAWHARRPGLWQRFAGRHQRHDLAVLLGGASQGRLMDIVRRAVPGAAQALAASGVHPVLARVFAARGVATPEELDHDLATLPPFATMKGIDAAAARLADAIAAPGEDPDRRRLRRRRRHRLRGRRCAGSPRWAPSSISSCRTGSSTAMG